MSVCVCVNVYSTKSCEFPLPLAYIVDYRMIESLILAKCTVILKHVLYMFATM